MITVPFVIHEHEKPYDFTRFIKFGIEKILDHHGFEIDEIIKTNHYIEVIFQSIIWYNSTLFNTGLKFFTIIKLLFLIMPFNLIGLFLSKIVPMRDISYNNLIVLASSEFGMYLRIETHSSPVEQPKESIFNFLPPK